MESIDIVKPAEKADYRLIKKYERSDLKFAQISLADLALRQQIADGILGNLVRGLPDGSFIAGGAVARWLVGQPPLALGSDVDVFFRDSGSFYDALDWMNSAILISYPHESGPSEDGPTGVEQFWWNSAIVQFIKYEFFEGGIEELLDDFDFTVCQAGIDVGARMLYFNPMTPADMVHNRIVVHRRELELKKRIAKYEAKGFHLVGELGPGEEG